MATKFVVREVFRLGSGITVLACEGASEVVIRPGARATLVGGGSVRQSLSILGEQKMLNASAPRTHRAIETGDTIQLAAEEARSGTWLLVLEE